MSHLIVKRASDGLSVVWHQDNNYWHSVKGSDITTVWLAIEDTDRSDGCMRGIPRSHEGCPKLDEVSTGGQDLLGLTVEVTSEMEAGAICLEMPAGNVSLHGSDADTSRRQRETYTMRYANAKTVAFDTAQHWVPVHLVRGATNNTDCIDIRSGRNLPEPIV